jgi:hypothetical protein
LTRAEKLAVEAARMSLYTSWVGVRKRKRRGGMESVEEERSALTVTLNSFHRFDEVPARNIASSKPVTHTEWFVVPRCFVGVCAASTSS